MAYDAAITEKSRDLIVLEKARERIARGWCTLEREDKHGNVCLRGALAFDILELLNRRGWKLERS